MSQIAGESSMDGNMNSGATNSSRNKNKVKRFLQYIIPPVALCVVTVGIFVPSYHSDPVSKYEKELERIVSFSNLMK